MAFKKYLLSVFIYIGIHCEKIQTQQQRKGKNPVRDPYEWAVGETYLLSDLVKRLTDMKNSKEVIDDKEKICLGAVVLTEAILIASPSEKIPTSRLWCASDFEEYSSQPWGMTAYEILASSVKRMTTTTWEKKQYDVKGFTWAITLWALSAVPVVGMVFGTISKIPSDEYPLCLKWSSTQSPKIEKIKELETEKAEVNTVIGNPEYFAHLVQEPHEDDIDFLEILKQVEKGYKLKKTDWDEGFVDAYSACEGIGEEHVKKAGRRLLSDSQKLDMIIDMLEDFDSRIKVIESVLQNGRKKGEQQRSDEKKVK